jgi:hypothetical protein
MTFDPTALGDAFEANREIADSAEGQAPKEDYADKGLQTVAADLGLNREQANALMAECLRACVADRQIDLAEVRKLKVPCWIAVGMAFGWLAHERTDQEANADGLALDAEDAKMLIAFIGHEVGFGALQDLGTVGKLRRLANT